MAHPARIIVSPLKAARQSRDRAKRWLARLEARRAEIVAAHEARLKRDLAEIDGRIADKRAKLRERTALCERLAAPRARRDALRSISFAEEARL